MAAGVWRKDVPSYSLVTSSRCFGCCTCCPLVRSDSSHAAWHQAASRGHAQQAVSGAVSAGQSLDVGGGIPRDSDSGNAADSGGEGGVCHEDVGLRVPLLREASGSTRSESCHK